MAVYTKINEKEISYINKKFEIDTITKFKGIKQGIENTNYLLKSKNKKFILTIFEKRVSQNEIPFFMKLMDQLNNSKINCPKPQKNKNGNYLVRIRKKSACIVSLASNESKFRDAHSADVDAGYILSMYVTRLIMCSRNR